MASRMQVANFVAERLDKDRAGTLRMAAAWLVAKGRRGQARYLAMDVAEALVGRGYVAARVTTARAMSAQTRTEVERFIKEATGGQQLELETAVDPAMIGGIRIETPGRALDASVRAKLARYVMKAGEVTAGQ